MVLQGNKSNWQQGQYFESWLNYVSVCPSCSVEIFNTKSRFRDVSKVVQCVCGARMKFNQALAHSKTKSLINKHTYEIITMESEAMGAIETVKAAVGIKPQKEKTRTQILKNENKELKISMEANRVKLREEANTTSDGRTGNNSDLERKERELGDKLLANNLELCEIDLVKVKNKFQTKKDNLDKKKTKLEEKLVEAQKAINDFVKDGGDYDTNEKNRKEAIDEIVLRKGQLQNAKDYQ